jgi:hypothetical protein
VLKNYESESCFKKREVRANLIFSLWRAGFIVQKTNYVRSPKKGVSVKALS